MGYWDDGKLQFVTNVGTGFDDRLITQLTEQLDAIAVKACPFSERPPQTANAVWVKPELVCEVKFQEWTPDGRLRAPVFMRLRDDVDASEVKKAQGKRAVGAGHARDRRGEPVAPMGRSRALRPGCQSLRTRKLRPLILPALSRASAAPALSRATAT